MKTFRVYLDTSVIGGCFDAKFADGSRRIVDAVLAGKLRALLSDLVFTEVMRAPEPVREMLRLLDAGDLEVVSMTTEAVELQQAYIAAGILTPKWANDALHVAVATVARADAIVSWNFRHIVRLDKIKAYNQVNFAMGYGVLTILSPTEVSVDDTEND